MKEFRKTKKQSQAIELMKTHIECLFEGGSRSGKTFNNIRAEFVRGINHPGTRHLAVRKHFNHAKAHLWYKTIPDVIQLCFPNLKYKPNKTDWFYSFGDGSEIWIAGTDDKERIEKLLGGEWDTIFMNEASEQVYDTYELLKTRLNPKKGVKPLFLIDQNPAKMSHWTYTKFHLGQDPATGEKLTEKELAIQCHYKMNPIDNIDNLNEEYLGYLETLSEAKKKRFLYGQYGDDTEGALWKSSWISSKRLSEKPQNLIRVVVAIDPNVTDDKKVNSNTDEAGIITIGEFKHEGENHYVVIRDDSTPGLSWGQVACDVFRAESADRIIGEVNQGGDLIEMNLRNYDRSITYSSVRATRGKEVRAEPIADLYRRGFVHHLGMFPDLENELTTWVPGDSRSPNRLDALVWGISYLAGISASKVIKRKGW